MDENKNQIENKKSQALLFLEHLQKELQTIQSISEPALKLRMFALANDLISAKNYFRKLREGLKTHLMHDIDRDVDYAEWGNTKKWEMVAYVICGLLAGISAIFFVSAYTTVQPGFGDQYNNEAIAGCVKGGTSMAGGLASISGTIIGVFIIALLQEGILALGFTKDYQLIITGAIVIAAVYSDVVARRRKN